MNKQQGTIRRTLLAMAIAAFGASGAVLADTEVEPNFPVGRAQVLEVGPGGSITVQGAIKNASNVDPDVDLYSFHGMEGQSITIDIDGTTDNLDANLHLFGPSPAYERKMVSEDVECSPVVPNADNLPKCDDGSSTATDPLIGPYTLPATGMYTVAVAAWPVALRDGLPLGNEFEQNRKRAGSSGAYTLTISGLMPATQQVMIDIKPGNRQFAPINPHAKGTIPVAILWSSDFDPSEIDENSLKFGPTGNEASFRRCNKEAQDVNGKGPRDRVCHFDMEKAGFRRGHTAGVLKGTKGGKAFEGRGDLKVIPEKRGD
jgi:hypothetical protein